MYPKVQNRECSLLDLNGHCPNSDLNSQNDINVHLEWASMCWGTTCSIIPAMHCCLWCKTATHQTQTASFDQLGGLFTPPPFGKRIVADVDYCELNLGENVNEKFELQENRCTNIWPAVQKMPILTGRSKKIFSGRSKIWNASWTKFCGSQTCLRDICADKTDSTE